MEVKRPTTPSMTLTSGTSLGPYAIQSLLGSGGMGEVYRARDRKLDRDVAIKVLAESLAQDSVMLARFHREAKVVAALSHPNILSIHDFGTESVETGARIEYAVMELLEGETLRKKLEVGPVSRGRRSIMAYKSRMGSPRRTRKAS